MQSAVGFLFSLYLLAGDGWDLTYGWDSPTSVPRGHRGIAAALKTKRVNGRCLSRWVLSGL